jgi:hypothetical protein
MTKHTNPIPASESRSALCWSGTNAREVRTRFLGNIATPVVSASPLKVVEALWGGELPAFDSIEGAGRDEGGQPAPAGDGEPERGQGGATRVMNISRDSPGELISASLLPSEIDAG